MAAPPHSAAAGEIRSAPAPVPAPIVLAGILAVGAVVRSLHFFDRPSLSMDEARLANNLAARSLTGLLAPLDYDQSAPPLFLWAERLLIRTFGVNELALRALSLLAGIGLLWMSYLLLRRMVGARASLLGVATLAAAPAMVTYSNEVKQYMLEALVAVTLVHLALRLLDHPRADTAWRLAAAGAVAVWVSGSAILVLAGIAPVLLVSLNRAGSQLGRVAPLAGIAWAASFALAYYAAYRAPSTNPYLARFWAPALLSPSSDVFQRAWLALEDLVWGFIVGHSGLPRREAADLYIAACVVAGMALVAAGAWYLTRAKGFPVVALLLGPVLVTVLASVFRFYPVGHRLVVFAVPLLVTAAVAGLEAATLRLGGRGGWRAWWVAAGIIVLPLLAVSMLQATVLETGSRMREVVRDLEARQRVGEPVYVFGRALPAWEFYTTDWNAPDSVRLAFFNRAGRSDGPAFENAPSRGRPVLPDEGDNLTYRSRGRLELVGIPTGMEYRALRGLIQRRPDPGWFEREAQRIRNAASPAIWVVMTEFLGPEFDLFDELSRRGGRVTYGRFEPGHALARYEFGDLAGS